MYKELSDTTHRPFPIPTSPWVMTQTWENLLFLHWPVSVDEIQKHLPPPLEVDTFKGVAYIGIVPFFMNNIRFHGLPQIPFARRFLELNVRTYVKYKGVRGVYFFSLDANHFLSVATARTIFKLPYLQAKMSMETSEKQISFRSQRVHTGFPPASFHVDYEPLKDKYEADQGTLEEWLTERYCLLTTKKNGVYKGDIHHEKWTLQDARIDLKENKMVSFLEVDTFNTPPVIHYSENIRAFIWSLRKC